MLRRTTGRILQLLGLVGLPGDLRLWYNVLSAVVPAGVTGIVAYVQQASLPTLVLLVLGTYVVFFLASIPVTTAISRLRTSEAGQLDSEQAEAPRAAFRVPAVHTGSIGNIGHVENLHITTGFAKDEPQEQDAPAAHDELDYETRLHFKDEPVHLALFALSLDDIYIRNRTFTNCRVYGPAVIVPSLPSTYESTFVRNCTFYSNDPGNFLWLAVGDRSGYIGLLAFEGCVFEDCDFYKVGLLVQERDYEAWLNGLRAGRQELEEPTDQ